MERVKFDWELPKSIEKRISPLTFGRQRIIYKENHLLIILHEIPKEHQRYRSHVVLYRHEQGEYLCNGQNEGKKALKDLIKRYEVKLEELDKAYENANSSTELFKILGELVPINRAAKNMAEVLQDAFEATQDDDFLLEMRDYSTVVKRSYEILLDHTKLALDFQTARSNEEQSEKANEALIAQHRLNILAALFFPITAVATIFGMNLTHGYEEGHPILFWLVLIIGIAMGIIIKTWMLRMKED